MTKKPPNSLNKKAKKPSTISYVLLVLLGISVCSFVQMTGLLQAYDSSGDSQGSHQQNALESSLSAFKSGKKEAALPTENAMLSPAVVEDPIPNPELTNGYETVSACLLVMDDNHRLIEWMAYHYHVLPLRYLVIAVDPRSKTSPTAILNRWRRMGVYVEEWDDFNFMRKDIASNKVGDDQDLQIKRDRHRMRQKNFYQKCLQRLKAQNRTYTTLIDTDEYITYNYKGGDQFEAWEKKRKQITRKIPIYKGKTRVPPSSIPPTTAEEGGLLKFIRTEQTAGTPFFQSACISCPRLQFGAKESSEEERKHGMPDSLNIDPFRLDTLRFRLHAERQDFVKNGLSKSILDVSRVEKFPKVQSLHRPIKTICSAPWKDEWSSGLRINHYLGSWEAYSFRDDSRRGGERSFEGWAFKAKEGDDTDDNIRPWVDGFVEKHGPDKATELLQDAGLPRGMKGNDKNWTIMFLDEILSVNKTEGNPMRVAFDNFVRDFHFNEKQEAPN
ncbi:MAG: hypothetical protein SGBAC_009039 [Bacillariaceae sp.]